MAPEYAMQGMFSVKSDVYSFGVLVLEIVSGRKNNSFHNIDGPLSVVEYVSFSVEMFNAYIFVSSILWKYLLQAWELWRNNSALELMDPTLRDSCLIEQVERCIHIGLLCVENHAVDRPTIEDVVSMLKNERKILAMPNTPAFITRNNVFEEAEKLSANDVTVSEMEGR